MKHYLVIHEGEPCKVTNMFDAGGAEVEDPADAVSLVAMIADNRWLAAACDAYALIEHRPS